MNNEAYSHFSNPFQYSTNLSFINYPWNLLSPQTYYSAQKKKRKKLREQIANEKSIKEVLTTIEPTKKEILEWYILGKKQDLIFDFRIKSLSVEKRYEIFSIENAWLSIVSIKMYQKYTSQRDIVFALLFEENKKTKYILDYNPKSKNFFFALEMEKMFLILENQKIIFIVENSQVNLMGHLKRDKLLLKQKK